MRGAKIVLLAAMFRTASYALFIFLVGFAASAALVGDLPFCENALVGRPFTEAELAGPHRLRTFDQTVIIESQQLYDGLHQFILKRKGKEWGSTFVPVYAPNAPVGTPYAFAIMVGSSVAHALGYSIVDDRHIVVPSIATLNNKIENLEAKLAARGVKPSGVRFYFTKGLEDGERYNREFAHNASFPISEDPALFLHDLSFHLGSFAIPPQFVTTAQKVTSAVNLFADELKKFQPKASKKEIDVYDYASKRLVESETQLLDLLFGNIVGVYTQAALKKLEPAAKEDDPFYDEFSYLTVVQSQIFSFFSEQRNITLRTLVQERFRHMLEEEMYWSPDPQKHISEDQILAILDARLESFVARTPELEWNKAMPHFDAAKLFAEIGERIAAMKAAIETP